MVVRLGAMAGGEDQVWRAVSAGERAADGCGGSEGCGDSGDNLEGHASSVEGRQLFGSAAKDERVAALETHNAATSAGVADHQGVDLVLRNALAAAALAHVGNLGRGRGEIEDGLRNQVVVEDDVRGLDEANGFDREQVRVAGT